LISAGEGHLWHAASTRGPTAYTSFYARRGVLAARRDEFKKLVRALYRTQKWVNAASPETLAAAGQSFFPEGPVPRLQAAGARCRGTQPDHAARGLRAAQGRPHLGRVCQSGSSV